MHLIPSVCLGNHLVLGSSTNDNRPSQLSGTACLGTIYSNTKYLFLSCEMMKYLKYARWGGQPLFHNVTYLELKTIDYSWTVLPALLECFPNLITFVFHKEGSLRGDIQFQAPKCSMYLEEIKLTGIKGCT